MRVIPVSGIFSEALSFLGGGGGALILIVTISLIISFQNNYRNV